MEGKRGINLGVNREVSFGVLPVFSFSLSSFARELFQTLFFLFQLACSSWFF